MNVRARRNAEQGCVLLIGQLRSITLLWVHIFDTRGPMHRKIGPLWVYSIWLSARLCLLVAEPDDAALKRPVAEEPELRAVLEILKQRDPLSE